MITAVLLTLIVSSLFWGWFLHGMTLQRNVLTRVLGHCNDAMRADARRIRVLRDDNKRGCDLLQEAADTIVLLVADLERSRIELAQSRHALAVQIAGPEERMALLGRNVVPIRGAR